MGHGPECQEGGQDLGEQEDEVEGVDSSLQRQDDNSFIGQEEQQYWQLEHKREEPEGCQLWCLMIAKERERVWVGRWKRCKDRAVRHRVLQLYPHKSADTHLHGHTYTYTHTHTNSIDSCSQELIVYTHRQNT